MTSPAIRTIQLSKQFGAVRAIDQLTLEIPRGIIFGFLGLNGSGKTTTVRLPLGLLEPTTGSAQVLGYDMCRTTAGGRIFWRRNRYTKKRLRSEERRVGKEGRSRW